MHWRIPGAKCKKKKKSKGGLSTIWTHCTGYYAHAHGYVCIASLQVGFNFLPPLCTAANHTPCACQLAPLWNKTGLSSVQWNTFVFTALRFVKQCRGTVVDYVLTSDPEISIWRRFSLKRHNIAHTLASAIILWVCCLGFCFSVDVVPTCIVIPSLLGLEIYFYHLIFHGISPSLDYMGE